MIVSALVLIGVLLIFTLGKSPVFRVDRAGAAIIGATMTVATGVLSFDQVSKTPTSISRGYCLSFLRWG